MSDDLVAFLTARLDEDEERALYADDDGPWRAATDVGDEYNRGVVVVGGESPYQWGNMIASCGVETLDNGDHRAAHIAHWDPARVLAEVAAKRRIIELHQSLWPDPMDDPVPHVCAVCHDRSRHDAARWPCDTLRLLALPFADHPDYQESWRPE